MSAPAGQVEQRMQMRVRRTERTLTEGLLYVEAYLPFDPVAWAEFEALRMSPAAKGSAKKAAELNPQLAEKALTPIDTHGEAMLQPDVCRLARNFIVQKCGVDVMHDEQDRASLAVVESFVNTPEIASPNFWPGAWVVVIKVSPGTPEWDAVEGGTLDAVSFQGLVNKVPIVAKLEKA